MNTIHKAISSLFLATFLTFTPNLVKAQVDTTATSAQVEELRTTLIALLTQLIAQLQAQIIELLAQQATQAMQLGAVSTKVDTVMSQTVPKPEPIPEPIKLSITYGSIICQIKGEDYEVNIPMSFSYNGSWSSQDGSAVRYSTDGINYPSAIGLQPSTSNTRTLEYVSPSQLSRLFLKATVGKTTDTQEIIVPSCQ